MASTSSDPDPASGSAALHPSSADLLVVGCGVAGLRAAIEAASAGLRVILLAKDTASDSNTDKAQGGVAVALSDEDEVGLHSRDTIAAGDGLCDEEAVRVLVEEGPKAITELIDWGAQFDREGTHLAFTREGAHSARRVLHAAGDSTGQEIVRALLAKIGSLPGIAYVPNTYTMDLLMEEGRCAGLICLRPGDRGRMERALLRGPVLLATGGCGQVYRETTNPPQATGDGVAMAYRSGAWVRDMEFVQFHPTSLAVEGAPRFLLSEALRGEGGVLRDARGERFMTEVDPRVELAPRDVVARAIARVTAEGRGPVTLDLTHLDPEYVARRFPRIHATCLSYGVDIARKPVPVTPSAHYMMGGVATDLWGRTSLPGLYAAGEAACTGVHGANRLASNSLLEGLVFGARSGRGIVEDASGKRPSFDPGTGTGEGVEPWFEAPACETMDAAPSQAATARVRAIASERAGLTRDASGLESAIADLSALRSRVAAAEPHRDGVEARNLLIVAWLIASAARLRRESRGAHFRRDWPSRDDARFRRSILLGPTGRVRVVDLPGPA